MFPSVRRLLSENPTLSFASISATGPKGTVTKGDVLAALARPAAAASPAAQARSQSAAAAPAVKHENAVSSFGEAQFTEEAPSGIRKARNIQSIYFLRNFVFFLRQLVHCVYFIVWFGWPCLRHISRRTPPEKPSSNSPAYFHLRLSRGGCSTASSTRRMCM